MATTTENTPVTQEIQDLMNAKDETQSTVSVSTLQGEEPEILGNGKHLLHCNICGKVTAGDSDMSQILLCKHVYIEKKGSTEKKRFKTKFEEMVFRMKAIM